MHPASEFPTRALEPRVDLLACLMEIAKVVLKIIDLNIPDHVSTFAINDVIRPILLLYYDGRRLIFETDRNPRRLGVVDLDTSRILAGCQNQKPVLYPTAISFTVDSAAEIMFKANKPPVAILDLD